MVEENNVNQLCEEEKPSPFNIKLKDFDGRTVLEMRLERPLQFPYLFYKNRLFVTSRDEIGVLLERSYCVYMDNREIKDKADKH